MKTSDWLLHVTWQLLTNQMAFFYGNANTLKYFCVIGFFYKWLFQSHWYPFVIDLLRNAAIWLADVSHVTIFDQLKRAHIDAPFGWVKVVGFQGSLPAQVLDLVHDLCAAVVTLPRVTLGVSVMIILKGTSTMNILPYFYISKSPYSFLVDVKYWNWLLKL